jgi:hypothetical protein
MKTVGRWQHQLYGLAWNDLKVGMTGKLERQDMWKNRKAGTNGKLEKLE